MKQKQIWIDGASAILALALLAVLVLFRSSAASGKPAEQETPLAPAGQEIEHLRAGLRSDQLSEPARRSLEEKLAMAEKMSSDRAEAAQVPRQEKVAPPLPAAAMENLSAPVLEGIFEGSQGLVRPSVAIVENVWQGERDGGVLQVFAGALPDNPRQGIVLVARFRPEKMDPEMMLVPAPRAAGPLRISEAQDGLLVLSAGDGSNWYFDLQAFAFRD